MNIRKALAWGKEEMEKSLREYNLSLDSSLLLCHTLSMTREKLYACLTDEISSQDFSRFQELVDRRSSGYPLAYITGLKEFYGRNFHVMEGVLCPRPDTETLVEESLKFLQSREEGTPEILDLCTGTGCIALTLEKEMEKRGSKVTASDISPHAEQCFLKNREMLHGQCIFVKSHLFDYIEGIFDLIATNPPYLTEEETQERMDDSWKEPALALDGGIDGLDLIRIIIEEAPRHLKQGGALMIEAHPPQMKEMARLMEQRGFSEVQIIEDLAEHERVIKGVYRG